MQSEEDGWGGKEEEGVGEGCEAVLVGDKV